MSKPFMFEKPLGMRDTLPQLFEGKKTVSGIMADEIEKWGYQFLETPALEYYETIGEASAILDQQLFKLLDSQGRTLVLRPDMTGPIARVAASSLYKEGCPLRLACNASVFRAQQREGGRPAEFEQIGVECIGDPTISADAEVIALMIQALRKAGLEGFNVAIGHIGFVNSLFLDILGNEERAGILKQYLYEKNYVGYREHVKSLQLSTIDKERLFKLLQLRGNPEKVMELAGEVIESADGHKAAEEMKQLWSNLEAFGVTDYIKLDLNLVSHMSYYTGIHFEVNAEQLGFLLGNGGRYDQLLEKFDRPAHATGFGIRLDRLLEALSAGNREPALTCVMFSLERRLEAIEFAADKRNAGERVVLQDISGVGNLDACTDGFKEVVYFIGKSGKENTHE